MGVGLKVPTFNQALVFLVISCQSWGYLGDHSHQPFISIQKTLVSGQVPSIVGALTRNLGQDQIFPSPPAMTLEANVVELESERHLFK